MNHFVYGVLVGNITAGLPILAMVYFIKKFLDMFEQDLHEALAHIDVPSSQS